MKSASRAPLSSSWIVWLFAVLFVASLSASGCGRTDLTDYDVPSGDGGLLGDGGPTLDGDGGKDGRACTTAEECDDRDKYTSDFCSNGRCTHKTKDGDDDGAGDLACGGTDCNDSDPKVHPGAPETCTDKADNDCNGLVDCKDPSCKGQPGCACGPAEICGNVADDDCNGKSDCDDPACAKQPGCACGPKEICNDGVDDDCNGEVDCNDPACAADAACACRQKEDCSNGIDDDCNGIFDCKDPSCKSDAGCQCRTKSEICSNGRDDNCDGLIDCTDPRCEGSAACSCTGRTPAPEQCTNGIDDDCNGKADCADAACAGAPSCQKCSPEVCGDGADNDCNDLVDCADPACRFAPSCKPVAEICDNGLDDDHNGLTDCDDPACKKNPLCVKNHENCLTAQPISASGTFTGDTTGFVSHSSGSCGGAAGEAVYELDIAAPSHVVLDTRGTSFDSSLYLRTGSCSAGRELACDDDSGGSHAALLDFRILYPGKYFVFVDGFTIDPRLGPDEGPYVLHVSITPNPAEICDNGVDDDGDRFVDCADGDCTSVGACLNCNGGKPPSPELGSGKCTDGQDNDCDGKTDCADTDCHASDFYVTECCNGRDDNGNGIVDDFSCRCVTDSDCPSRQRCYRDTAFACGPACTTFVGDICPFVAPGATCSTTTLQCEYGP